MGLLDGSIKKALAKGFKGKLLKGTVQRVTSSSLDVKGDRIAGVPQTFSVEGFVDEYDEFYRRNAGIPDTDLRITLIGGLMITEPAKGDNVMFATGEWAGQWFQLRRIGTDPAGAAWVCQAYVVDAP